MSAQNQAKDPTAAALLAIEEALNLAKTDTPAEDAPSVKLEGDSNAEARPAPLVENVGRSAEAGQGNAAPMINAASHHGMMSRSTNPIRVARM